GSRPVGLATTVDVLEVSENGDGPVVTAMLTQEGFTWEGGANDGISVAALPARCTRIHLSEVDEEWFVHKVSACAAEESSGQRKANPQSRSARGRTRGDGRVSARKPPSARRSAGAGAGSNAGRCGRGRSAW